MPVRFQCSHCLSGLTVSRRFAGKRGRCPNCKARVDVPELSIDDPFDDESGTVKSQNDDSSSSSRNESDHDGKETDFSDEVPENHLRSILAPSLDTGKNVTLPRWVVYLQGALLGLTATTFFVFGMAVGNTTSGPATKQEVPSSCVVTGNVYFDRGQERVADQGAVIIMLPVDSIPRKRPAGKNLNPVAFEPVRNDAMDEIRRLGGCVVRVDSDGSYEAELENGKSYWWLVLSRNKSARNDSVSKQTRAELGTYFLPIEDLLGNQAFVWDKVRLRGRANQELETVSF